MSLKDLLRTAKASGVGVKKGAIKDKLAGSIDKFLTLEASKPKGDHWGDRDVWHPSSLSWGVCPRAEVMKQARKDLDKGKSFDPRLLRIFGAGHGIHWMYQNLVFGPMGILWGVWRHIEEFRIGETGEVHRVEYEGLPIQVGFMPDAPDDKHNWVYAEVPVFNEEHNIGGSVDGLIILGEKWFILEVKSINARGYGFISKAPREYHLKQAMLYLDAKPIIKGAPVPEGIVFVYHNKDTQEETFHVVDGINTGVLAPMYEVVEEVKKMRARKKLPGMLTECKRSNSKRRRECPLGHICLDLGNGTNGYKELMA